MHERAFAPELRLLSGPEPLRFRTWAVCAVVRNPEETSVMWNGRVENDAVYQVVVNHEGQYSLWPSDREPPLGWRGAGKVGPKDECLAFVEEVWTDMRPLSLRKTMDESR